MFLALQQRLAGFVSFFFPLPLIHIIKSAYVFTREKTANLVEGFWKGKMSGEKWKRCRTETQGVCDPILNLSRYYKG